MNRLDNTLRCLRIFPGFSLLGLAVAILLVWTLPSQVTAEDRLGRDRLSREIGDSASAEVPLDSTSTLNDYLAYAAANSPALRAAFFRWQASMKKAGYAGALPDPQVSYGYFIENVETRVGPQEHKFSLRQSFPWFGTLGARKDMAAQAAKAAYEKFQAERLSLFYRVKLAYYEYYFLGRDIDLTRENLVLLTYWESVVRKRYEVALSKHPDVIKAQVELGELEDRLLSLEDQLKPAQARLRAALDLGEDTPLPVPTEAAPSEVRLESRAVIDRALTDNPNLSASLHTIDQQRAAVKLAGRETKPSFSLGVDYIATGPALDPSLPESGKDPWTVSVGMSLPIWFGKNRAKKAEAAASLKQSQYDYEEQKNQLEAATERILFEYGDALRRTQLYRDGLVPKARQALNAGYAAYESGDAEFLSVLDAQRQLLAFELRLERSRADLGIKQAEIEMITGRDIKDFEKPQDQTGEMK